MDLKFYMCIAPMVSPVTNKFEVDPMIHSGDIRSPIY
jgi:hypothetical protein